LDQEEKSEDELSDKVSKQICVIESGSKNQEKIKINIFETNLYENPNVSIPEEKAQSKKNALKESIELENRTKQLIPDYNFDTFGTKEFKNAQKNIDETKGKNNTDLNDDSDSNENEEKIIDVQCRSFSLEITHETRNFVRREKDQEENRRKLPIYLKESEIIDSINNNFITIVCGETGSGLSMIIFSINL